MALSDFQSKKLIYLFRTFFDTDHNGTIEKPDFDLVANKISKMRNWSPESSSCVRLHQRLDDIWEEIKRADSDGDGNISEKEWLELWTDVIIRKNNHNWVQQYQDFIFDAQDTSGDGSVDESEFTSLYVCLGIPNSGQCGEAFRSLTAGGPPHITKETFVKRFQEFISSDDKTAPGNYLFGCGTF